MAHELCISELKQLLIAGDGSERDTALSVSRGKVEEGSEMPHSTAASLACDG